MEALLFALHYFTNFPIYRQPRWDDRYAAASLAWLPFTGLMIGLCLVTLDIFFVNTGFPQSGALRALALMGLELWVGGARFLEGFSKTCDGLFAGPASPGRRGLERARDSQIGRAGVIGLVFATLAKLLILTELSSLDAYARALAFYPCWSRWAYSFAACRYEVAGEEGMAYFFKVNQKPVYIILSSAFTLMALMLTTNFLYIGALGSFIVVVFCCSVISSRLGGHTEESYGMAAVVSELSLLFISAASGLILR